ncbi:DUF1648 domain-containing protein [Staphylococcus xylosus]|uniref:DUF1648 domain-containing protein n=2 Tax=Staphylococcus xylosus TaxID=1288 RepID=UPI0008539DC3|nr:DUF1648 domain-containing protein [Staphylococcus xylosus]MBG3874809.1 DUF1648 domain-containing protein [Staphylococcus xylosus]MBM6639053.1 DUF1648 domain-containing protein [Staphylococcus xylosus]MDW8555468.1 DUF1648 domain-containing protein [Staphylococcus xylosus]MEB6297318.1 DUF1648 domain-containing protein [Staphylococcus xylosus]MEB6320517.1 DUF1648 domain-containing protein [Staphylococcus xylosus]
MNKILNIASFIMLILLTLYTWINYSDLPKMVPIHYDLYNHPDGWGDKNSLFLIPFIGLMIWFLMYSLYKYYPKLINLDIKLKGEQSTKKAIKTHITFVAILNFEIILFISLMGVMDIYNIKGGSIHLGNFQFVTFAIVIGVTLIWLVGMTIRTNENDITKTVSLFVYRVSFILK